MVKTMDVNFEYYKIFYYVAKYQNFTKAAYALKSSQPNVTRAINCLEQQLHATLFLRTNRGAQLTPEGQKLYVHVSAAMQQILLAQEELEENSRLLRGNISIGASETALNIYLLNRLKTFHMEYPGIRLKIYNTSTPQAIRSIRNGQIDFAVVSTPVEAELPLKKILLKPFQEILIGGKTFSGLEKEKMTLKEIKKYPMIALGRETVTYQFYNRIYLESGIEFTPDTEVATADQILPLVRNELGLAFIPELIARDAINKKEVIKIPLKTEIPQRNICMIYDCQHPLNAAAEKLKKMMIETRD